MKKLFAIFALVGILLQTFNQVVIVAAYYAQKDYIAKNLCENRNKPMMHCDGKCCLKKKLAKESKDQLPNSRNQKSEQVVNLFCAQVQFEVVHFPIVSFSKQYFSYNELKTYAYHHAVFHPPTV